MKPEAQHRRIADALAYVIAKKTHKTIIVDKCRITVNSLDGKDIGLIGVRLESKDRGQGNASKALTRLFDEVDVLGVPVILQVQPMDKKTTREGLVRLYSRFGFKRLYGKEHKGYFMMQRSPQKKDASMALEKISSKLAIAGIDHVVVAAPADQTRQVFDVLKTLNGYGPVRSYDVPHLPRKYYAKLMDLQKVLGSIDKKSNIEATKQLKTAFVSALSRFVQNILPDNDEEDRSQSSYYTQVKKTRGAIWDSIQAIKSESTLSGISIAVDDVVKDIVRLADKLDDLKNGEAQ